MPRINALTENEITGPYVVIHWKNTTGRNHHKTISKRTSGQLFESGWHLKNFPANEVVGKNPWTRGNILKRNIKLKGVARQGKARSWNNINHRYNKMLYNWSLKYGNNNIGISSVNRKNKIKAIMLLAYDPHTIHRTTLGPRQLYNKLTGMTNNQLRNEANKYAW